MAGNSTSPGVVGSSTTTLNGLVAVGTEPPDQDTVRSASSTGAKSSRPFGHLDDRGALGQLHHQPGRGGAPSYATRRSASRWRPPPPPPARPPRGPRRATPAPPGRRAVGRGRAPSRRSMRGWSSDRADVVPDGTVERWTTSAGRPGPRSTSPSSSPPSRAGTTRATPPPPRLATSSTAGTPSWWPTSTPEEFYDFTSTRPEVRLDDDGLREIVWPATEIYAGTIPGDRAGRAAHHRHRAAAALAHLLRRAHRGRPGPRRPPLPHARRAARRGAPHPAHPDRRHRLRARGRRRAELQPSRYEGPTGIVGVLHDAWRQAGPPLGVAVGHGPGLRPGRPVARRRPWRWSSGPPRCCRRGSPPPTSRSRRPPTSAR